MDEEIDMSRNQSNNSFDQTVKKFFLSAFVVVAFLAYILHDRLTAASPSGNNGSSGVASNGGQVAASGGSQVVYKNGTYTGPAVDAYYGMVQAQATVQNGKITDVQFLNYPHDRRTSQMINNQAMPWLQQEVIQAQSAQINIISGATLTSQAFASSLQSALNSASN
jgi:uncharacterized protein with FMN-binding domain